MAKDYLTPDEKQAFSIALSTNDIGWNCPDIDARKVYLLNPEVASQYNLVDLVDKFKGTGHSEWEFLWAYIIINYSRKAIDKGRTKIELTNIFDRDFWATQKRVFTREQVWNHLIKFFDIVEDKKDFVKLIIH